MISNEGIPTASNSRVSGGYDFHETLHRLPNQLAFMLAINIRLKKLLFYIFVLVCQHVSATKMASYYNQGLKEKEMVRRH